jgi:hypothetical protein
MRLELSSAWKTCKVHIGFEVLIVVTEGFCLLGYNTIYLLTCICALLSAHGSLCCFFGWLFLCLWRWRWFAPQKYWLIFTGLRSIVSQKVEMSTLRSQNVMPCSLVDRYQPSVVICSCHFQGRCFCIAIRSAAQKMGVQAPPKYWYLSILFRRNPQLLS